jgi:hypothetical protein
MTNLTAALEQLRAERTRAQQQVQKLEQAITVIESLNGASGSRNTGAQRIVSAAARRKMSLAQKARWAKARNGATSVARKPLSAQARKRIAAAQRARWARVRAQQKAA